MSNKWTKIVATGGVARCPEHFLFSVFPHLSPAARLMLGWAQRSCAQSVKNDSVRSLVCQQILLAAKKPLSVTAETVKLFCPRT